MFLWSESLLLFSSAFVVACIANIEASKSCKQQQYRQVDIYVSICNVCSVIAFAVDGVEARREVMGDAIDVRSVVERRLEQRRR